MAEVIKRVIVEVDSDTKKLTKGFKKVNKEVGFLTKGVKRLGVALVAAFGARALFSGFKQTLKSTDDLIKKAKGVGFTVDEYERLVFALDQVGISAGSAKIAIGDFQKRLSKAVAGTSPQFAKAFEQAGLDINALSKMEPAAAFQAALTHLATLVGDPRLAGFTGNVFEEQSGKDVKQIIELWSEYTNALEEHSSKVGELTKSDIRNIAKLNGEVKLLGAQWDRVKQKVVAEAAPDIIEAIESISDSGAFDEITTEVTALLKEINKLIDDIKWLKSAFDGISDKVPDWISSDGGRKGLRKFTPWNPDVPNSIFDVVRMAREGLSSAPKTNGKLGPAPPPYLASQPVSGAWQPTARNTNNTTTNNTTTNNITIKAARGSYEITDTEARRIKKAFDEHNSTVHREAQ